MTAHEPAARPSLEELLSAHGYLKQETDYHMQCEKRKKVENEARLAC